MINDAISKLVERVDLDENEVSLIFEQMMNGELTNSQIAAFLVALRIKGETIQEITGASKVMVDKAVRINHSLDNVVDLCGTGGDNHGTFNISTTASFVVAGAGVPVAKHGNRSVSSPVGSADVLEELGVNINLDSSQAEKCLEKVGITFLFAPVYHPAMKNVAIPRKEIGIRTIFNLLGPILNPALVKHQVMGVYAEVLLEPVAKVLRNLGSEHALVVHGSDSMDEITVTGTTSVAELKDGIVKTYQLDPTKLGFKKRKLEEILGGKNNRENADLLLSVLRGEDQNARRDITVLNAAAAIFVSNKVAEFSKAVDLAKESIDGGKAIKKLEDLVEFTNSRTK
ncbi:MAG: anthranilate phosphoribosyltransferase [Thermodesulfobacteriota bacterium]